MEKRPRRPKKIKYPKLEPVPPKTRKDKIDDMYKDLEAAIYMHVDDQADSIYLASLLLTSAKNMFLAFLQKERTIEVLEMLIEDLNT